jgi:choline dehydrogenase
MGQRVVVLGAGSAGCIAAARLSEDAGNSVVLIEAGPDYPDVLAAPDDIRSGFVMGGIEHDWGYLSEPSGEAATTPGSDSGVVPVLRGKVVGGSSAVNGTAIRRPRQTDFDAWVATGNTSWTWADVLPALCDLEDDPAPGAWHGQGGPLHIHRFPALEMRPVHRAFLDACTSLGYPLVEDHNAPGSIGAGPIPLNQVDGVRQSAAVTHLARARGRPNLSVRSGVTVDRLELEGRSARGVWLTGGEQLDADLVVLAAGVYGSPAILMRSGIGPSDALAGAGIEPRVALPAVGRHLRDHPMFVVSYEGNTSAIGDLAPPVQTLLTFTSDGTGQAGRVDLEVAMMTPCAPSDWFTAPLGTVVVGVGLMKPRSVGDVRLDSADPTRPPRIRLNFYDDPKDLPRMVQGVNAARELMATPAMKAYVGDEQFPGATVDDDALPGLIRAATPAYAHATGTCRMGPDAGTSVVDQTGRVHGADGLWVIDASIMPALPSVPTNLTTMMLAERCIAWLRGPGLASGG